MHFKGFLFALQLLVFPLVTEATQLSFDPPSVSDLFIGGKKNVTVYLRDLPFIGENCPSQFNATKEPSWVLGAELDCTSIACEESESKKRCNITLVLEGRALGLAKVYIVEFNTSDAEVPSIIPSSFLDVAVIRPPKVIHKVFNALVATIVSINYINMGCALDMKVVKSVVKKPIGPIVGMVCQLIIMPVVAYGVGLWLLSEPALRLGLFTFGSSPGGGASNMWTVLLRGNLNLSITMTFFSAIISIGTIPLWLFTLGKDIVRGTTITIPFSNIALSLVAMAIPVSVGLLIQKYLPRVAKLSRRILAPVCIIMIIIIVILGSIAYWELLLELTWRIVIAASLNVWLGFLAGFLASLVFRFSREDIVAVTVETGIQNTGIAYLLLNYSLKPPASEIASVVPVAASIITPLPLLVIYCVQKIRDRCCASQNFELQSLTKSQNDTKSKNINGVDNMALESD